MKLFKIGLLGTSLFVLINNGLTLEVGIYEPSMEIIEPIYDNRSIAMGKTATTTARGSSAIFSDPSILGTFSAAQIQVGGKIFSGTIMNENPCFDRYASKYPAYLSRSFFALSLPYEYNDKLKLVFGIGYQRYEGVKQYTEYNIAVSKIIRFEQNNITKGQLTTLTPGIAINLQDKYFLGATLSQVVGDIFTTSDTKIRSDRSFDESTTEQSARFLRLGAFAKLNPELTVGLMYRTEFVWILKDTITISDKYGKHKTDRNQLHRERPILDIWGIGAEYWVSPEFAVALEAQSRPLSKLERIHGFEVIIDNVVNFSLGGEYLGLGFPLRVRVFRDVNPRVDYYDTAPRNLIGVTAGIGSKDDSNFSWNASLLNEVLVIKRVIIFPVKLSKCGFLTDPYASIYEKDDICMHHSASLCLLTLPSLQSRMKNKN